MRRSGTKGVPRAEREQQILDVACREFGRNGYAGMSLGAVALQAGISKPMVVAYFGSKEQLYIACVQRAGANVCDHIEAAMAVAPPTLALPRAVLRAIFQALSSRPTDWGVIWDQTLPAGSDALDAAREVRSRLAGQAGHGVAALGDASTHMRELEDLAVLTHGWMGMVGAIVNWWMHHPDQSAEQMADRASRVIAVVASAGVPEADGTAEAVASPLPGTAVRGSESGKPLMAAFDLLGRRWAILIIWELRTGTMAVPELRQAMGAASTGVVAARLSELVTARIVRDHNGRYGLTPLGRGLLVAVGPLEVWARVWSASLGSHGRG